MAVLRSGVKRGLYQEIVKMPRRPFVAETQWAVSIILTPPTVA